MRFVTLIARNMLNRSVRTALTVLGLSVGIAAVMILTGVAWGFERSFMAIYQTKGIDLVVVRAGISNQLSSNLDASLGPKIRAVLGVARRHAEPDGHRLVRGQEPRQRPGQRVGRGTAGSFNGVRMLSGRSPPKPGRTVRDVILGRVLGMNLGKTGGRRRSTWRASVPRRRGLRERQPVRERRPDHPPRRVAADDGPAGASDRLRRRRPVVRAGGSRWPALGHRIEAEVPGVAAVPARDFVQVPTLQIRLTKTMAWATTAVALVLGSIGLLNTMVMTVFERTGEVGLLRALGWRRQAGLAPDPRARPLSWACSGTVVGTALAYLGVRALLLLDPTLARLHRPQPAARCDRHRPGPRGWPQPDRWPLPCAPGLAHLDPTEALRHD